VVRGAARLCGARLASIALLTERRDHLELRSVFGTGGVIAEKRLPVRQSLNGTVIASDRSFQRLAPRERDILALLMADHTCPEVAAALVGRELGAPRHLLAHVGVERAPIERGEPGALLRIGHHHQVPALRVGAGRRLERDLDRALDHRRLDGRRRSSRLRTERVVVRSWSASATSTTSQPWRAPASAAVGTPPRASPSSVCNAGMTSRANRRTFRSASSHGMPA